MPIKISAALIRELPEHERKDIRAALWDKAGGVCFLCGRPIVESTDVLVADHDIPEAEGGKTQLSNLNLVHSSCNSFKRSHPTIDVRPFLRLSTLIHEKGGLVRYDQAVELLGVTVQPVDIADNGDSIKITFPNGKASFSPVFTESNKEGKFRFAFVELPKSVIYNDDECQPRSIKLLHLWSIYTDVGRNPLHEAPACRLAKIDGSLNSYKLLLFDGQHKSLAFWLSGREAVVTKLYLDISKQAAVKLVNSVQAKIKKLPLSPFELAGKMAEEWQERVAAYEDDVGTAAASEAGFVAWVEKDERGRAKSAFVDALYQSIIEQEDLAFGKLVLRAGQKAQLAQQVTETTFKNKVLKPLLHLEPLIEKFDESTVLRERETRTVVKLLNMLYAKFFEPSNGSELSPQEVIRAARASKQASLYYIATLLRSLVAHRLVSDRPREFLDKEPSPEMWVTIDADIERIAAHPLWTADLDMSKKMAAIKDALEKNQGASSAFSSVGLKLGYVVGADVLDPNALI